MAKILKNNKEVYLKMKGKAEFRSGIED